MFAIVLFMCRKLCLNVAAPGIQLHLAGMKISNDCIPTSRLNAELLGVNF